MQQVHPWMNEAEEAWNRRGTLIRGGKSDNQPGQSGWGSWERGRVRVRDGGGGIVCICVCSARRRVDMTKVSNSNGTRRVFKYAVK